LLYATIALKKETFPVAENNHPVPYEAPTSLSPVPSDKQHEVCLEQYKAYISDLGNIGTRYATVQGFYVSVIVALLSVLALAESNKILSQLQTGTLIVVCLFAVALCFVWALTIRFYKRLFRAKFGVLKALEGNLAYRCFDVEFKLLKPEPLLLSIESNIPIVLSLFFVALALIKLLVH
jgi:uncharacterized YccA/Bax inhibitor family protein